MAQEQLVRSMYDAASRHDIEAFVSCFADDGEFKDMSSGHVYRGKSELRSMAQDWMRGLPDLKLQVNNVIGSGDLCSVELSVIGTQTGPFRGPQGELPPSGKKVDAPSCDVIRLRDDKIQSIHCYFATSLMMDQLGMMPGSAAA
jgi:steroid delta-isomerase-like uncharacterized protein